MSSPSELIAAEIGPTMQYRRLSSLDVRRMMEAGILEEDCRVELIGGMLLAREPQSTYHSIPLQLLTAHFARALDPAVHLVRIQLPLVVDAYSEPEPDLTVVSAEEALDASSHPRRPLLVIEISDTRLRFDRGAKRRLYAAAGFPEYWVLDVGSRQLLVYRDPQPAAGSYADERIVRSGESVVPLLLAVPAVEVAALFR